VCIWWRHRWSDNRDEEEAKALFATGNTCGDIIVVWMNDLVGKTVDGYFKKE
jgi:hypothetical protein